MLRSGASGNAAADLPESHSNQSAHRAFSGTEDAETKLLYARRIDEVAELHGEYSTDDYANA